MFPIIKLDWAYLVTKDMISHRHTRLCKYKFETYDDFALSWDFNILSSILKYYGMINTGVRFCASHFWRYNRYTVKLAT